MSRLYNIKDNLRQIFALTELNLKLAIRFKFNFLISFITPIISLLMPLIIIGRFFSFNVEFGPWTAANFAVFLFMTYNINLLRGIITKLPSGFKREKFWHTLPGLLIAPFNRINLLFGILLSHFIIILIPFTAIIFICFLFYNISIFTILFLIVLFLLMALIFSGIGLLLGIFSISNENIFTILDFLITYIFWFSCLSYPFEVFPGILQDIIQLNPFYYIFDIVRLAWIEDDFIYTITSHFFNFFIITGLAIILPIIGVLIFNKVYKKYGIVGY